MAINKIFKRWNGSSWEEYHFYAYDSNKLNSQLASYYLNYDNFTNTPQNVSEFANDMDYVDTDDSRLSDARPASDVSLWAKSSSKPSYDWSEIGSKPTLQRLLTDGAEAITATGDWDDYINTGFYMGSSLTNECPGGSWRYCLVIRHNSSWVVQTMMAFDGSGTYQRNKVNGTWSDWVEIVRGDDSRLSDARTPTEHDHTKSQITDFPTSMPASDVSTWAKRASLAPYDVPNLATSKIGTYDGSDLQGRGGTDPTLNSILDDISQALYNVEALLQSDESTLDTLQEVVDYIETNRDTLDTLGISNITGLQTALNGKMSTTHPANNHTSTHLYMANGDGFIWDDTNNIMKVRRDGVDSRLYHEGHKPTASEIGAMPSWDKNYNDLINRPTIENYNNWYLQVNGGTAVAVGKAENVDFHAGSGINITRSTRDITVDADPVMAVLGSTSYGTKGVAQYRKSSTTLYIKLS